MKRRSSTLDDVPNATASITLRRTTPRGVAGLMVPTSSSSSSSRVPPLQLPSCKSPGARRLESSSSGTTPSKFVSCLTASADDSSPEEMSPHGQSRAIFLQRSLSTGMRALDNDSWLSSSLVDLAISRLANRYRSTHFMSCDFAVFLSSGQDKLVDIRGQPLNNDSAQIVLITNVSRIHWNMVRIGRIRGLESLQVYEPMGMSRRGGEGRGLSLRTVPKALVAWLDSEHALASGKSWLSLGRSAITTQQQLNGSDCGVAALLYAELAGLGRTAEEINSQTRQDDISSYRAILRQLVQQGSLACPWGKC